MTTTETTSPVLSETRRCARAGFRAAIADHFAGRGSPGGQATLRAHLLGCADCDALYRRHLMLARLDPRALPAIERLGRGLGFRSDGPTRRWRGWALGLCVPAAALLLVLVPRRHHGEGQSGRPAVGEGAFATRGAGNVPSTFWAYRLASDGTPRLAEDAIGRADELAFAYANPAARPFLMIFGVDEHRHVYWFHPGWPVGTPAPQALTAQPGPGPHELPEAIRQPFDGGKLRVFAAFGERPFDAKTVEDAVRTGDHGDPSRALGASGVAVIARTFEVTP